MWELELQDTKSYQMLKFNFKDLRGAFAFIQKASAGTGVELEFKLRKTDDEKEKGEK